MDYVYNVTHEHPFYKNRQMRFLSCESSIVGIKEVYNNSWVLEKIVLSIFDCELRCFVYEGDITSVPYNEFVNTSCYFEELDHLILIDIENKNYTLTSAFPFMVCAIDGNYVETCMQDNKIYIFHSHTDDYETGVFIFDIESNTFNSDAFALEEKNVTETYITDDDIEYEETELRRIWTNTFSQLHRKNITSCYVHKAQLYIKWNDTISSYDPISNVLIDVAKLPEPFITECGNIIVAQYWLEDNIKPNLYDTETLCLIGELDSSSRQTMLLAFSYKDKLVCMSSEYENPYGQIYDANKPLHQGVKVVQYSI